MPTARPSCRWLRSALIRPSRSSRPTIRRSSSASRRPRSAGRSFVTTRGACGRPLIRGSTRTIAG
jgi:hypothetical protein